ncbi:MAG: lysozyme inhibitor LprI family protein [Cyanobacteria bacterium P01_B01_bin.77]
MDNLTDNTTFKRVSKSFSWVLLLALMSCGGSQSVSDPVDSVEPAAESSESSAETADVAPPSSAETAVPERDAPSTAATEPPSRSAPVALAKKDCEQMVTQIDMNQCAAENYSLSDKQLNQVYREVLQTLDTAAKARLTKAEERWIVFRDAQCGFESDRFRDGSIAPLIQASCMEQITDNRIAELQQATQAESAYAEVDAQLNQVYQAVQAQLGEAEGEALTDVQLSWLDYRDAHCEFEANLASGTDENACLAATTETRVWQLQALQDTLAL